MLAKFGFKDELKEIVFELVSLDMPNETLEEVLTYCEKTGVDIKGNDSEGNNLLHLLYENQRF